MTAPERIWVTRAVNGYVATDFGPQQFLKWPEYILHTRAVLAASPLVQEIVAEAFRAGFNESGEGWNGEHPCTAEAEEWLASKSAEYATAIRARGEGQPQENGGA